MTNNKKFSYKVGKFVAQHPVISGITATIIASFFIYSHYEEAALKKSIIARQEAEKENELSLKQSIKDHELATKNGFISINEMNEFKQKGFNTKIEFLDLEAKKLGFDNHKHMQTMNDLGIKTAQELAEATIKMNKNGFSSIEEMTKLAAEGFNNKGEKIAQDKKDEALRLANNKEQKERNEWHQRCMKFVSVRQECATAGSVSQCMEIKMGAFDFSMARNYCNENLPNFSAMGKR